MSKSLLSVVGPFALVLLGSAGFTVLGGNAAARFPAFTPTAGLPEGIAVDKSGTVYASVAAFSGTEQLWKFSRSGQAELVADFGSPSGGAAGLTVDAQGNAYVAIPSREAVVRIDAVTGVQETLGVFPFAALDVPLSLAFGTGKGERTQLFITNNGISAGVIPGLPWSGPGILKIDAGVPGLPLP